MVESFIWGAVWAVLGTVLVGIRRLPWRHCAVVGLGFGIVLGTMRVATMASDTTPLLVEPWLLVSLGAIGGGMAQLGFERGEQARKQRSAAILGSPHSPVN